MTRFFLCIAALLAVIAWLFDHPDLSHLRTIPLIFGVIICVFLYLLDRINYEILESSLKYASSFEKQIRSGGGVFSSIFENYYENKSKKLTYYKILRNLYLGTALTLFCLGLYIK